MNAGVTAFLKERAATRAIPPKRFRFASVFCHLMTRLTAPRQHRGNTSLLIESYIIPKYVKVPKPERAYSISIINQLPSLLFHKKTSNPYQRARGKHGWRDFYLECSVEKIVFAEAEFRSHSMTAMPFARREYVRGVFGSIVLSISAMGVFG